MGHQNHADHAGFPLLGRVRASDPRPEPSNNMRTVEKARIEDQIERPGVPWRRARDVTKTRRLIASRAKRLVNGCIKSAAGSVEVSITGSAVAQGQITT